MPCVIGIDVGSQSVKGVLADESGGTAVASAALTIAHPRPGWAEQDPAAWMDALARVVRTLLHQVGAAASDVTVLALACQVDGVVPVSGDGTALRPAIIWLDRRADREAAWLVEQVGEETLFGITGLVPDSSHTIPKILWLREHEPETYGRAAALPPVAGYLLRQLTGVSVLDHANASSSLVYDVRARGWSPQLLDAAGLDPMLLGEIRESTEVAGPLLPESASLLGLTTGCQVLVGTGDDHAGAVGAGVVRPGPVADITGTAEPVAACSTAPVFDDARLVETHAHAVPGRYLVENPGFVSGGSILWLARILGVSQQDVLDLAASGVPGADGLLFLPALSGSTAPRWNAGMRGAFAGLSMSHDRVAMARAVVEGCAFALRDVTERLAALGVGTEELHVVGGGCRSRAWLQVKADVTGRTVRAVEVEEATAQGAALLAAVAAGAYRDLDEAVDATVALAAEPIAPEAARRGTYDEAYGRYRALFDAVEEATT